MKIFTYLLLTLIIIIASIQPFAVFAEPTLPTFSVTNSEVEADNTFTVFVQMSENPGVSSLFLRISFDRNKLEVVSVENVDISLTFSDLNGNNFYEGNPITFSWIDMSKEITTATTLAKLTFKIKDDAKAGEVEIKVAYDQIDIFDMNMNDVVFDTISNTVTIVCKHTWDSSEVTNPATHTTEGTKTYTCTSCGKTKTESIPVIADHTFEGDWKSNADSHWQHCDCGAKGTVTAHTYDDWKVTKEATETEKGSKERSCSVCDYKETAKIDVLAPSTPDVPPTGDKSVIMISVALVALFGISVVVLVSRKKKTKYTMQP